MKAFDFEYDGLRLSDLGFVICTFDSKSVETVSMGSEIKFNTVSTLNGMKYELTSSQYDDCVATTFQVCKNFCDGDESPISLEDIRKVMSWLNRKKFHKFKLLDDEYAGLYFEASFNVKKIEVNGMVYGFELDMTTNRPFAVQEPVIMNIKNLSANGEKTIVSTSDEEGFIYPDMEIELNADGTLEIGNDRDDKSYKMVIENCKNGEVITVEYPMIRSSVESHKIQNDFNWKFFRIASTFKDKNNKMTVSLPCSIKLKYSPIAKVGI